eukprot:6202158-Pleurochrysis_carterae.AAC.4
MPTRASGSRSPPSGMSAPTLDEKRLVYTSRARIASYSAAAPSSTGSASRARLSVGMDPTRAATDVKKKSGTMTGIVRT